MTREADPAGTGAASPLHVVVVGGGFAGVSCAQELADAGVRVTLLDKHNYHQFQPLLYQVATAQLAPDDVGTPLRNLFRKEHDVAVQEVEVTAVDPATRTVATADGATYTGDYLVVAVGAQPNFFRTSGAAEHTMPLYSLRDAERLRSRVIEVCDAADRNPDLIDRGALTFVVVGGGATGVEIAGALADFLNRVVPEQYPDLPAHEARVHLVDHGNALLGPFSDNAHEYAAKVLQKDGVRLHMGAGVQEVAPGHVRLDDGTVLRTRCVVWAGGLKAAELAAGTGLPRARGGRVVVGPDLSVEGYPRVFVLGDVASVEGPDGDPYPQLGSVALQQGGWAAKNILAEQAGEPRRAFHYRDKGTMAMIGRGAAVAEFGKKHHELHGAIAFSSWLGVHAWLMSGIRSRTDAFISWGWDYFSGNRAPELLDHPEESTVDWSEPADIPAPRSHAQTAVPTG